MKRLCTMDPEDQEVASIEIQSFSRLSVWKLKNKNKIYSQMNEIPWMQIQWYKLTNTEKRIIVRFTLIVRTFYENDYERFTIDNNSLCLMFNEFGNNLCFLYIYLVNCINDPDAVYLMKLLWSWCSFDILKCV